MRWFRGAAVLLASAFVPTPAALADTIMDGERHVRPVYGQGSVTATGIQGGTLAPYSATLETSFEPARILPGEGFTFVARNTTKVADQGPGCTNSANPQTRDDFNQWYFSIVDAGALMFDLALGAHPIGGVKTETIDSGFTCPFSYTIRQLRHVVSGADTAGLAPGCYQATTTNAGYDYPFPFTWYSTTVVKTLEGTVGTLKVGTGTDCDTQPRLTVNRAGPIVAGYRVKSVPSGIDCGADCVEDYNRNQVVTLTAEPPPGYVLSHWEGPCQGTGPCLVTMLADEQVTAVFAHAGDADGDGVLDDEDNCRDIPNPGIQQQNNDDGDELGDACDDKECNVLESGLDACALEPGDILVWRSREFGGFIEGTFSDTYFTHAALVVGYVDLDRRGHRPADADCVNVRPAEPKDLDPECELAIVDALPGVGDKAVALRNIRDVSGWGLHDLAVVQRAAFRLEGLPAASRLAAARAILNHLLANGALEPVNQGPSVWKAPALDYSLVGSARGPDRFYCSSLVWWAYEQVGIDLNVETGWGLFGDALFITPDDVLEWPLGASLVTGSGEGGVVSILQPEPIPPASGLRAVAAAAAAPRANLMLVDSAGRRTGVDADGVLHLEIPGAHWRSTEYGSSVSAAVVPAQWTAVVSGRETGPYGLSWRRLDGMGATADVLAAMSRPGESRTLALADFAAASHLPLALDDAVTVTADSPERIDVLANDFDGDGDLQAATLAITHPPAHGRAGATGGSLVYTGAAGYAGADQLSYQVCDDDANCTGATLALTVRASPPVGPPPGSPPEGATPGGGLPRAGALPRIAATVTARWSTSKRGTRVVALAALRLPAEATVRVTCTAKRAKACRKPRILSIRSATARLDLAKPFKRARLAAGAVIEVRITAAGREGKVFRYTLRRTGAPRAVKLCVAPDAHEVGPCA